MALFESYDRRINQIIPVLEKYGMKSLKMTQVKSAGITVWTWQKS